MFPEPSMASRVSTRFLNSWPRISRHHALVFRSAIAIKIRLASSKKSQRPKPGIEGIIEPFTKLPTKTNTQFSSHSDIEGIIELTLADILPPEEHLELIHKNNLVSLTPEQQKVLAARALEIAKQCKEASKSEEEDLLKLANDRKENLTAFANTLLLNSPHSSPVSFVLYRTASNFSDPNGAFSYASMLYRGYRGTPPDPKRAISIFTELSQKGHPYAQMALAGYMAIAGEDIKKVIELYELSGASGINQAWMELGTMFRKGNGVEVDHERAIKYFKKGADEDDAQCNFMLGVYHSKSIPNTPFAQPDDKKAFQYFEKAASKGIPEAQYNTAHRHFQGLGTPVSYSRAGEYYKMAAAQGFPLAQVNLARMYIEGRGVTKNTEEARRWLQKLKEHRGVLGDDARNMLKMLDIEEGKSRGGFEKCIIL